MVFGHSLKFKVVNRAEEEVDAFIKDAYSFRDRCVKLGNLFGKPNYILNVYDNMQFDTVNEVFNGEITVYCETSDRGDEFISDLALVASRNNYPLAAYQRRLKVDYNDV